MIPSPVPKGREGQSSHHLNLLLLRLTSVPTMTVTFLWTWSGWQWPTVNEQHGTMTASVLYIVKQPESIYFLATTDNLFEHSIAGLLSHVKSHITLLESSRYSRCGTCLHQTSLLRSGPSFQLANLFVGPALPFHMLGFPPRFLPSKLFAVLRAWSICSHHWVNPSWALFTPWKSFSNFSSSSTFLFCRLDTPTDLLKQNNRAILYSQTLLLCAYTIYNPIHNVLAILDGRPVIQSLAPKIQMFGFGVR